MVMTPAASGDKEELDGSSSRITAASFPVLALYPNLRQTGWAVFRTWDGAEAFVPSLAASGTVGPGLRTKMEPLERISRHLQSLATITERWHPRVAVCSWPGGMDWGAAGMHQLEEHLRRWADGQSLDVVDYGALRVRAALAGKSNASKEALAYSIMERLNLVGEYRSALEWEAIAVGYYHLALRVQEG